MVQLPSTTEVLIIGSGLVGLALAAEMRRRGVDCVIVDQLAANPETSRAAVVHARTLEGNALMSHHIDYVRNFLALFLKRTTKRSTELQGYRRQRVFAQNPVTFAARFVRATCDPGGGDFGLRRQRS